MSNQPWGVAGAVICPTNVRAPWGNNRVHDISEHQSDILRSRSLDNDVTALNSDVFLTRSGFYEPKHRHDAVVERDNQSWQCDVVQRDVNFNANCRPDALFKVKSNEDPYFDVRTSHIEYYYRDCFRDAGHASSFGAEKSDCAKSPMYPPGVEQTRVQYYRHDDGDIDILRHDAEHPVRLRTSSSSAMKKRTRRLNSLESIASVQDETDVGATATTTGAVPSRVSRVNRSKKAVSCAIADVMGLVRRLKRFSFNRDSSESHV